MVFIHSINQPSNSINTFNNDQNIYNFIKLVIINIHIVIKR